MVGEFVYIVPYKSGDKHLFKLIKKAQVSGSYSLVNIDQ